MLLCTPRKIDGFKHGCVPGWVRARLIFPFVIFLSVSMASVHRPLPSSIPDRLRGALELRAAAGPASEAVERTLSGIAFFSKVSRFGSLGGAGGDDGFRRGGWRGSSRPSGPASSSEDGFEVVGVRRRPGGGGGGGRSGGGHGAPIVFNRGSPAPAPAPSSDAFSSAAMRNTGDIEDRILVRVKGKINKMGPSTYDATKTFMQQILEADETEFLDEFMKFVFQKAATESAFCGLYARLIHELADEFPHLRDEMIKRFRDYIAIFSEVGESDVGIENMAAFKEAQEHKKFRRGYSQFVAELVKLGEADKDDFAALIKQIVGMLEKLHTDESQKLLSEEYIDCLANMCRSASSVLSTAPWFPAEYARINAIVSKPKDAMPGFSNKARFALMDLADFVKRGWK
jgi:hypothetical protein